MRMIIDEKKKEQVEQLVVALVGLGFKRVPVYDNLTHRLRHKNMVVNIWIGVNSEYSIMFDVV